MIFMKMRDFRCAVQKGQQETEKISLEFIACKLINSSISKFNHERERIKEKLQIS